MNTINSNNNTYMVNIPKKEISELKLEEQNKVQVNDISKSQSGVKVVFEDSENGNLLALNLSKENFQNLQSHFGSYTNYVSRDDGSVRLNGEAQNFISSWFANASKDISLNTNEGKTSSALNFKELSNTNAMQRLAQISQNTSNNLDFSNTEEKLNFLISKDTNEDGKIEEGKEPKSITELLSELDEMISSDTPILDTQNQTNGENPKLMLEQNTDEEEENLLQKAEEQGLSALTMDEQIKLEALDPLEFERLKNASLQGLRADLTKDLKIQVQNNEAVIMDKKV